MTALFCKCAILVLISIQQSQSQMDIGITQDRACLEQCPIGYKCSMSRGFSECVPGSVSSIQQQLDSVISSGSGEPITWNTVDQLSPEFHPIDSTVNTNIFDQTHIQQALEYALQKIMESRNSVSNIPGPENTTPGPGEIVTNPGSRATPKDTNIIVTQNPTTRTPERRDTTTPVAVTGCKKCTENSQCTVDGEYCYHSPSCATLICQPL